MIVGIGVDLVKIDRIDKAGKDHDGFSGTGVHGP